MVRTKSNLGAKATKMLEYINHMIRVELIDGYLLLKAIRKRVDAVSKVNS